MENDAEEIKKAIEEKIYLIPIDKKGKVKAVSVINEFEILGLKVFIHKDETGMYKVSDVPTGLMISSDESIIEAIRQAKEIVYERGVDKYTKAKENKKILNK